MKAMLVRVSLLVAASFGAITAWVAAATFTNLIPLLAAIALLAYGITGALLLRLAETSDARADSRGRRVRRLRWLAAGAAIYMIVAQLAVGRAPARSLEPVNSQPDSRTWTLSDGARIAFLEAPLRTPGRDTPIIMLHDGPGTPALPWLAAMEDRPLDFAADSGFDVYYYDQRGAGLSARLDLSEAEPYSVAGHVRDLEEIRMRIGAEQIILAGHGWGATLAVNYLAEHPERVARLVLLSPAPLWYGATPDFVDPAARARISDVEAATLAVLERPPLRLLVGRLTAMTSPRAAHTLVHDWEADQWWTQAMRQALQLGQPRMTCRSDPTWSLPSLEGLGFFAYSYTVADALRIEDPRPRIGNLNTPALVVRGLCDYVQGTVAQDYLDALPGSVYVAIPGAGHLIWAEQQPLLERVVSAFLFDREVPLSFYAPRRSDR